MKKVKIGLLGFGTVAGGTFDILKKNAKLISKRSGCEIEVAKVFARNIEKALAKGLPAELATSNVDEVIKALNLRSIEFLFSELLRLANEYPIFSQYSPS